MSSSKTTESDSCPNFTTCSTTESETENNASEKIENLKDEISVLHQENAYLARRLNKLEDPKRKS
jgi:ubiquinone biosynthesis protein UbiJ